MDEVLSLLMTRLEIILNIRSYYEYRPLNSKLEYQGRDFFFIKKMRITLDENLFVIPQSTGSEDSEVGLS